LSFSGSDGPRFRLGRAKGSKHSLDNMTGEGRWGLAVEGAAHNLKPDADYDVGRQLRIVQAHVLLGYRFG
jgi:hypothetical protein